MAQTRSLAPLVSTLCHIDDKNGVKMLEMCIVIETKLLAGDKERGRQVVSPRSCPHFGKRSPITTSADNWDRVVPFQAVRQSDLCCPVEPLTRFMDQNNNNKLCTNSSSTGPSVLQHDWMSDYFAAENKCLDSFFPCRLTTGLDPVRAVDVQRKNLADMQIC